MTNEDYVALISQEPLYVEQGEGYKYIKKSVLQKDLLQIYNGNSGWELLRETVSAKGLWGVGQLTYQHPVSKAWIVQSGTASIPHIKTMRLSFPSLEAQCFKNACKKIGVRFGQLLNLDDEEEPASEAPIEDRADERMIILMDDCKSIEELAAFKKNLPAHLMPKYMDRIKQLSTNI